MSPIAASPFAGLRIDGEPVHIHTGGVPPDPAGPVLLLVHGAGMDGTIWSQQTRFLAVRGVRALAVDLPGHGLSGGNALTGVGSMADWLVRVCDTADLSEVTIAGHSMGTFIALEVATRFPKLVEAVALFGTATAMPVHPELMDAAEHDVPRAAALMSGWSHAPRSRLGSNPTPGLWMTGGLAALVERSRPGVLRTDLAACAGYEQAEARAATITCRALVVVGAADRMTPARSGRAMAAAMVRSTSVDVMELPAAGHMMVTEEPRQVRERLLSFVR